MRFTARTDFGSGESPYGEALRSARQSGRALLDLTVSNPTQCGFNYPADVILSALGQPEGLRYAADPMGALQARQAIAHRYSVDADRVMLTASTSEAYGYLLRLLCEPGDEVLVPSPSYPLFDLLARLHDVHLVAYPLVYHDGWQVDTAALERAITPRTRAIVVVHPNNPTGHFCSAVDRAAIYDIAQRHSLAVAVDEVFLEYPVEAATGQASFAAHSASVLTFVLGGLSKLLAMPGMKVAWTIVCGPAGDQKAALERLEVIADTFLSVATPQQLALPHWLALQGAIQPQIARRVRHNLAALDIVIAGTAVSRLQVQGGWTVVLRVPALEPDVDTCIRLMQAGVVVHPGSLYGFAERGWIVMSLLPEASVFLRGAELVVEGVTENPTR